MIIRNYDEKDRLDLERIHKQYENEFILDEFDTSRFINSFVVEDESGLVISIGGVRLIPEIILVTDKNTDVKTRREGLIRILGASSYVTEHLGHKQLHAFVQDSVFLKQLIKHGFRPTKGISILIDI